MKLRDAINNVLKESEEISENIEKDEEVLVEAKDDETETVEIDEASEVGGGATGISKAADPVNTGSTKRKADKQQGDPMPAVPSDGVTGIEDTDPASNTKAEGDSEKNAASIAAKGSSMKEHIEAMLDGEELSEEFKEKASTIFEAAVNLRVSEVITDLEEQYEAKLNEKTEELEADLAEQLTELSTKLDQYLDYAVNEWVKENEVAIQSSLRSEITEEFIEGLKSLFEQHYIDIPEEKVNVVEELSVRVQDLENELNEKINENIELVNSINEKIKDEIFSNVCEGLASTQIEKMKKLSETVSFDDEESYTKKLDIIKENYFPSDNVKKTSGLLEESFDGEEEQNVVSGPMANYLKAISRTTVKN